MLRALRRLRQPCAAAAAPPPPQQQRRNAATLSYEVVTSHGAAAPTPDAPLRTAYLLHGLLGQGRNWRMFGRRLLAAAAAAGAPDWRLLLVDLRNHGQSAMRCVLAPCFALRCCNAGAA